MDPTRRQLRKLRDSIPTSDPTGLYVTSNGAKHFITFDDLHNICEAIMLPTNATMVETELGKMHYSKDPTYNMRKR